MDRSPWKVATGTGVVLLLLMAGGALVFVYSGAYNVAATEPHTPLAEWALGTIQDRSIAARADDVPDAPSFDSSLVSHGFDHFRAMCVECHGAPGVDRGETGQGLNPQPPELSEEAHEFSDAELFWVTKHGIKFTGMPAFGPTHSDQEIWGIVAFVRELETLGPEEYGRLEAAARSGSEAPDDQESGHSHAPGTPDHAH